jgi:pentose-5-phosphate-3-epimerase
MMNLLIAVSIFAFLAISVIAFALRRVASPKATHPITPRWIDELSLERYRPMLRLLDSEDIEFLRSQPGFRPQMATRLRHQRCRIFRQYLKELNGDFACICMALKMVMLQAEVDRPELAAQLLRSQAVFAGRMLWIHAQVAMYQAGIGKVDIAGLLNVFDGMRLELRTLVPESAVWGS